MTYLPRSGSTNGDFKQVDLYITDANGVEKKIVADQLFANDKSLKIIKFDPIIAKQVRIVIKGSYGVTQDKFAAAAEIAFYKPIEDAGEESEDVSTEDIMELVVQYKEAGAFESDRVANALIMHLTAVNQYEEKGQGDKVLKHMEGFKILLNQQKENNLISVEAYNVLMAKTSNLIEKWQ